MGRAANGFGRLTLGDEPEERRVGVQLIDGTRKPRRPPDILVTALSVYRREGGMERYLRRMVQCLAELRGPTGASDVVVMALWDSSEEATLGPPGVRQIPAHSSKLRMLVAFAWHTMRGQPSVIVHGTVLLAPLIVLARVLSPRSRNYLVVYGIEVWDRPGLIARWIVRSLVQRIISVSAFTKHRMIASFGLSEGSFSLLHCAVDAATLERSIPLPSNGGTPPEWRLLTVSRLSTVDRYKNVDKVIMALPAVLEAFPQTQYYVIGEGDWRPELESLARAQGVAAHVHFLGQVDDRTRDDMYKSSHVFVLPSTREGFGIVFLEAWSHGLPVIASDQDAASEFIEHGQNGFCLSPEPESIAAAVTSLLADPERRHAMGCRGRARLKGGFDHDAYREKLRMILLGEGDPCAE